MDQARPKNRPRQTAVSDTLLSRPFRPMISRLRVRSSTQGRHVNQAPNPRCTHRIHDGLRTAHVNSMKSSTSETPGNDDADEVDRRLAQFSRLTQCGWVAETADHGHQSFRSNVLMLGQKLVCGTHDTDRPESSGQQRPHHAATDETGRTGQHHVVDLYVPGHHRVRFHPSRCKMESYADGFLP